MPILRGDEEIRKVLTESHTVAVLGASTNPHRPSFFVPMVVRTYGFRMFYVNPNYQGEEILGEVVYGSLEDIPDHIDIVDVFRRPSAAADVVETVRRKGCETVWFQPGTENQLVIESLSREGFKVIEGNCMKVECRRLL